MTREHLDVIVVGAGLSGIAAGYYLKTQSPTRTFTILEGREAIGGTWDLFRYPGVRSDSDMYTLGYTFNPWHSDKAIADGESILNYIRDTADKFHLTKKIRFNHRVVGASWSTDEGRWTVDVQHGDDTFQMTCNFLMMCTGYYRYSEGYTPEFEGIENFQGQVIHPQKWDESLDYEGKKVVVIGSGATAVTLVPAMAEKAQHVTMLQRSPTYIVSMPAEDPVNQALKKALPKKLAYRITRWKAILFSMFNFYLARWSPDTVKNSIIDMAREELPDNFDVDKHLTPTYNPWDQRLCLVPDSDLFNAISEKRADIVTDHIAHFTENGVQLQSGAHLDADIVVTATGLIVKIMDGVQVTVDGEKIRIGDTMSYKGALYSNIPNLASAFGYTNASWTLKAELICEYVCRILNHMTDHDLDKVVAELDVENTQGDAILDFTSGYVQRALDELPVQGTERPWKVYQNYLLDVRAFRHADINDGTLTFSRTAQTSPTPQDDNRVPAMGD
ncbi:MAG: NAD(P)/FAD-dependent oxidoreductase [Chloroflexota bacterium]